MKNELKAILCLFGGVILWLLHHKLAYVGHFGFDDIEYAKYACAWMRNDFATTLNHYTFRWIPIVSLGIAYDLFGVNDFTSALPALLALVLLGIILYIYVRNAGFSHSYLILVITFSSPWIIFYSDKIAFDIWMILIIPVLVILLSLRNLSNQLKQISVALSSSLVFFLGVITKETIFFILPFWFCFFLFDICFKKRNFPFWLTKIGALGLITVAYLLWSKFTFGEALARVEAIKANSYFSECSYHLLPIIHTLKRVTIDFFNLLIRTEIAPLYFLPFFMSIRLFSMTKTHRYWVVSAVIMCLSANFFSFSFSGYAPLCLDVRHYMWLVPICGMCIFGLLTIRDKWFWILFGAFNVLLFAYSLYQNYDYEPFVELAFILLAALKHLQSHHNIGDRTISIVFSVVLCIGVLQMKYVDVQFADVLNYQDQQDLFYRNKKRLTDDGSKILVSPVQKNLLKYYMEFDVPEDVNLMNFQNLDTISPDSSYYLVRNWHTDFFSAIEWHNLPKYCQNPEAHHFELVDSVGGSKLFYKP